jgi:hypothetical protein
MNWRDEDIDGLFQSADKSANFTFDESYFKDIEEQLPVRRKRLLWPWLSASVVMVAGLSVLFMWWGTEVDYDTTVADNGSGGEILTNGIDTKKESEDRSVSNMKGKNSLLNAMDKAGSSMEGIGNTVNDNAISIPTEDISEKGIDDLNKLAEIEGSELLASVAENDVLSLNVRSIELLDNETQSFGISAVNQKRRSANNLFVSFGAGMGQSFITSTENGSSFTQLLGLTFGYERIIDRNFTLHGSIGFSQQMFDNLYIKERSVVYGFSSNTIENHYNFKALSNVDLNAGINYRIKRHQFGLNMNISKPIFASLSYTERINEGTVAEGSGTTDCSFFQKVFIEPGASYFFSLTPTFQLGGAFNVNFSDPVLSERIMGERTNLPLRGQVILKYNIDLKN